MEYNRYGYHGTSQDIAKNILSKQDFVDSNRDNEWLGKGVYFFAYPAHARWWVTHNRYRDVPTEVLRASLTFSDNQLLDLDDPDTLNEVNAIVEAFVRRANETPKIAVDFSAMKPANKWNFACNLVRGLKPQIGIISYTFCSNSRRGYAGYPETQKQYCVSDHSIIGQIEIAQV